MKIRPDAVDRLLRAAAQVPDDAPPALPFGFETRVIAHWRAGLAGDPSGLARLLRRVIVMSLALIVLAGAGAYRELSLSDDSGQSFNNDYAIADSAIGGAFEQ
jgi:hypothetical protein